MIRSVDRRIKEQNVPYKVPKTVSAYMPIKKVYEDGMMRCSGNVYSFTYAFSDINYMPLPSDDKEERFTKYMSLLSSLSDEAVYKLSIVRRDSDDRENEQFMPKGDGLDDLRAEYNAMIGNSSGEGTYLERYITVSVSRESDALAKSFFDYSYSELRRHFDALGSNLQRVNSENKLKLLHEIYRSGDKYGCEIPSCARYGYNVKEYICPDYIERRSDYVLFNERFYRALYLKDYASYIRDTVLQDLSESRGVKIVSVDILPVSTEEAVREIERKLLGVETNIASYVKKQSERRNFASSIPYDMELQRRETKEFLSDLVSHDRKMMFGLATILLEGKSIDELNENTARLTAVANKHMCQVSILKYQQMDGVNNCLPIGVMPIKTLRTLTSESLAVFMPFKVQEINERGGILLGKNAISGNDIVINSENLMNQSAFILGVPGSGKSMCCKSIIAQLILNTDDDILICDPEGEYGAMIKEMGLRDASVISFSPSGKDRINAMEMTDEGIDARTLKSDFLMSLVSQINGDDITPKHKSIIDRCLLLTIKYAKKNNISPTLTLFRECLLEQSEKEARDMALDLELYTNGSLDIFGHEGNVDLSSRITAFDIQALSKNLKTAALLVITDAILNRVDKNFKRGKRTHIFLDEFHVLFENEYTAAFLQNAWRQFRKRNAYPMAITQNVEYLLSSTSGSTMLSNSEYVIMLNQSGTDGEKLKKLLSIPDTQMNYAMNASPGSGIIKYGGKIVPFKGTIDEKSKLYELMSTKPGEGAFNKANGK